MITHINQWKTVPSKVKELVKLGSTMFMRLRAAMKQLPSAMPGYGNVWFNPKTQTVFFSLGDSDESDMYDDWTEGLKVKGVKHVTGDAEAQPPKDKGPWLRVKRASIQDILHPIAQAGGWKSGPMTFFNDASPLSATLASGVLGAGAGYGVGRLAEHLLPERYFEKGKLRRTLGIAGGLAGAVPGFWTGTANWRHGKGFTDPIGSASPEYMARESSPGVMIKAEHALSHLNDVLDVLSNPDVFTLKEMNKLADAYDRQKDYQDPTGMSLMGGGGGEVMPIEKDRFNRALWDDPFTRPEIKGMASGVAEGSSQIADSDSWFRPLDTARLGASMAANSAAGWASGLVAGKVMGALTGMNDQAQQALQRTGVWAGLITSVIPKVFGGTGSSNELYR